MTAEPHGGFRRLFAAVSFNSLGAILTAVTGVGATALMARSMPVNDFGRILLLLTVVNAFAIFEGLRPVIIHRVAAGTTVPGALFRAAARVNIVMVLVTLACLAVALLLGAGSSLSAGSKVILTVTVAAFFATTQFWMFLDAEQDTIFTGLARTFCWMGLYVAFAMSAVLKLGLVFYTLSLLMMHVTLFGVFVWRFRSRGFADKYRGGEHAHFAGLVPSAISNIVFNMSAVTINVADRGIVGAVMGAQATGLYAGPSELALRAVGLVRAGVQVILPWAARLSEREQERYWSIGTATILAVVGSGCAILLLVRESAAAFFLGPVFRQTGDLLGLFSIGIVVSTVGYACIVQFNARGDFRTQRHLYLLAAAILISGATWGAFSGHLGYVAAAYLAARSVDLILLIIILRQMPIAVQRQFLILGVILLLAIVSGWNHQIWWTMGLAASALAVSYRFWRTARDL